MISSIIALSLALSKGFPASFIARLTNLWLVLAAHHHHFVDGDLHTLHVRWCHAGRLRPRRRRQRVPSIVKCVVRQHAVIDPVRSVPVAFVILDGLGGGYPGSLALQCHILDST